MTVLLHIVAWLLLGLLKKAVGQLLPLLLLGAMHKWILPHCMQHWFPSFLLFQQLLEKCHAWHALNLNKLDD